jgi:hypothetical protein
MEQYKKAGKMNNFGYDTALHKPRPMLDHLMPVLKWLVPPVAVFAWIINIDNVKSTILFILAVIGMMIQIYHKLITNRQNRRLKDLDIKERERQLK